MTTTNGYFIPSNLIYMAFVLTLTYLQYTDYLFFCKPLKFWISNFDLWHFLTPWAIFVYRYLHWKSWSISIWRFVSQRLLLRYIISATSRLLSWCLSSRGHISFISKSTTRDTLSREKNWDIAFSLSIPDTSLDRCHTLAWSYL